MHQVLRIQEIVFNICQYLSPSPGRANAVSGLPTVARACRAFSGPALDILWEELPDPSPLAKCLPGAYCHSEATNSYSFTRALAPRELSVLRSYARRVRSILDYNHGLDWESVDSFVPSTLTEPLLPHLRNLNAPDITPTTFARMLACPIPFRSLVSLNVSIVGGSNLDILEAFIGFFSNVSPNIKRLAINMREYGVRPTLRPSTRFCIQVSSYLCRWNHLEIVECSDIPLELEALTHLSQLPALSLLSCTPSSALVDSFTTISLDELPALRLKSKSLATISSFLSRMRLPSAHALSTFIEDRPSTQDLLEFPVSIQTCIGGGEIRELVLRETKKYDYQDTGILSVDNLRPWMQFHDLRRIDINVSWFVAMTDGELLHLASAWPRLEELVINERCGWCTRGITPAGVVRLLQTSRSLRKIALAMDTDGFIEFNESPESLGLARSPTFSLNVLDSTLYEESVPAMADFLACIANVSDLSLRAFCMDEEEDHCDRWRDAFRRAKEMLKQPCSPFNENDFPRHGYYRFPQ